MKKKLLLKILGAPRCVFCITFNVAFRMPDLGFACVYISTVLLATKKVMEQLSAVYPELGRPGVTIPAAKPDGSIKREVSYILP